MQLKPAAVFLFLLLGLSAGLTPAFGFAVCGNGVCEPNAVPFGETQLTCPQDCGAVGDADLDTVLDPDDNCPFQANTNQADCDLDGQGDVCDADDAIWQLVEVDRHCFIDVDIHIIKWTLELYTEDRYRDISACNSPDRWEVDSSPARDHDCYILDHDGAEECCWDDEFVTPLQECNSASGPGPGLLRNDTCHR